MNEFYCSVCLRDINSDGKVYIKLKNQGDKYKPICKECAAYFKEHLDSHLYDIKEEKPNIQEGE